MTRAEILALQALHQKKGRDEQQLFICEGEKLIEDILQSQLIVRQIFTLDPEFFHTTSIDEQNNESINPTATNQKIKRWESLAREKETPVEFYKITAKEMGRISALKTPTPLLATVEIPKYRISGRGLKLVLDGVQNPGNIGTIIRIADWFGIEEIFCSQNSADCFNPKVVQATMGAIARVRVHHTDLIGLLKKSEEPIYGTLLEGENIYQAELSSSQGYIVMGSEGDGISPEIEALIERKLTIPSYSTSQASSESLNVATATAIVCSEFRRRERS